MLLSASGEYDPANGIGHADRSCIAGINTDATQACGIDTPSTGDVAQQALASGVDATTGKCLGGNLKAQINVSGWDAGTGSTTGMSLINKMIHQAMNVAAALASSYSSQTDEISSSLIDEAKGDSLFQASGFRRMVTTPTAMDPDIPTSAADGNLSSLIKPRT